MEQVYWFYKAADEKWHAYRLSGPRALCDTTAITYGVDPIADTVPADGEAHKGCLKAIAAEAKAAEKAAKAASK